MDDYTHPPEVEKYWQEYYSQFRWKPKRNKLKEKYVYELHILETKLQIKEELKRLNEEYNGA